MSGNLRDIKELELEIETLETDVTEAPKWGLTKAKVLDLISKVKDLLRSQAKTGGTLHVVNGTENIIIEAGWNRIDIWDRSVDTQGVQDGLADLDDPGGWFRITNAGAGDYSLAAYLRCLVSDAGDYEIRVAVVDDSDPEVISTTPYRDKVTAAADEVISLHIASGIIKNMAEDINGVKQRKLQLEIRGPNGSIVTPLNGQFGIWR